MPQQINDNFSLRAQKPLDDRYLKNIGSQSVPYENVADANSNINVNYRYIGLTVLIGSVEYWYMGGTTDNYLVEKTVDNNLDLSYSSLVSPVITVFYSIYNFLGNSLISTVNTKNLVVEYGAKIRISATYKYGNLSSGQSGPTSVSGDWGTTIYQPNVPSDPFTNNNNYITTNSSYSVYFSKPKTGLIINNGQVVQATGNDVTSDNTSVIFLPATYFGYSPLQSLNGSGIIGLGNKTLQSSLGRTVTGITSGNNYTYYCYPSSYGEIASIVQNNAFAVLGAFTKLTNVDIINDMGHTINMCVYRSNATGAFTDVTLLIS